MKYSLPSVMPVVQQASRLGMICWSSAPTSVSLGLQDYSLCALQVREIS